jgi:opacity protein-like surface antigen
MLRTIAASVIAFTVIAAAGASAHAQHFSAPSGLSGRATPSSGVIMISSERPQGTGCTGTYSPSPIEYAYGGEKSGSSGLIDGYIQFYSRLGLSETYEWRQIVPAKLRPFLQNVNFNWPKARDIASIGNDIETAYYQSLGSAECEAQNVQMAPLLQADASATPEPTTWAMLIFGVAMVGIAARRRSQSAAVAADIARTSAR